MAIAFVLGLGYSYISQERQESTGVAPLVFRTSQGGIATSVNPVAGDIPLSFADNSYGPANIIAGDNMTISTSTFGEITFTASAGGGGSTLHEDGGGFVFPQTGDFHASPRYNATSTSATSTFSGGLTIETSGFVYDRSTNFVGIGTTTSAVPLEVLGDVRFGEGANYNGFFYDATNATLGLGIVITDGTLHIQTGSAGSTGSTSSADDLTVENSADAGITILSPDSNISALNFGSPNRQTGAFLRWQNSTQIFNIGTGDTDGLITFDTGLSVERMRIDATGNVGIGTTTPGSLLTVDGSVAVGTNGTEFVIDTAGHATSTNFGVTSLTSAMIITDGNGFFSEYAGTSCTNQFVRSLSVLGAATCATVSLTADVTGTLPIANGGTNATSLDDILGTANEITVGSGANTIIGGDVTISLPTTVINESFIGTASSTIDELTVRNGTTTNATSTTLNVTGAVDFDNLTSALILTGATGVLAEYTGTSCTNQFVLSLSALGVATCNSINNDDWSGTDLTVPNGGTGVGTHTDGELLVGEGTGNITSTSTIGMNLIPSVLKSVTIGYDLFATSTTDGISTTTEFGFGAIKIPVATTITSFECSAQDAGTSTIRVTWASTSLATGVNVLYSTGVECGNQEAISTTTFSATLIGAGEYLRFFVSDASPTGSRPRLITASFSASINDQI